MIKISGHRLLVKRYSLEERDQRYKNAAKAGIVIPQSEEKSRAEAGVDRGEVIQIGPDCWKAFHLNSNPADTNFENFSPWCKVGDKIIFAKYAGKDFTDEQNDIKYVILNDEDVCAVIDE